MAIELRAEPVLQNLLIFKISLLRFTRQVILILEQSLKNSLALTIALVQLSRTIVGVLNKKVRLKIEPNQTKKLTRLGLKYYYMSRNSD